MTTGHLRFGGVLMLVVVFVAASADPSYAAKRRVIKKDQKAAAQSIMEEAPKAVGPVRRNYKPVDPAMKLQFDDLQVSVPITAKPVPISPRPEQPSDTEYRPLGRILYDDAGNPIATTNGYVRLPQDPSVPEESPEKIGFRLLKPRIPEATVVTTTTETPVKPVLTISPRPAQPIDTEYRPLGRILYDDAGNPIATTNGPVQPGSMTVGLPPGADNENGVITRAPNFVIETLGPVSVPAAMQIEALADRNQLNDKPADSPKTVGAMVTATQTFAPAPPED